MTLHEGGDYSEMISGIEQPIKEAVVTETTTEKNGWVHRHPYLATIVGIFGLLFLGIALVSQRIDVDPASSSGAWGGAGGMFFGTIKNAVRSGPSASDIVPRLQSPDDSYATIPVYTPSQDGSTPAGVDDVASLLAQLTQQTPVIPSSQTNDAAPDSYSFIPQGLVSVEPATKKRTAVQEDLFDYGNEVGTYVKGYEDTHYGTSQILKDHVEDRTNPDKIRALKILGDDMQQLGDGLRTLSDVPASAAGMHKVYANAYYAAGANLIMIAETTTDEEFLNAITKYNEIVDKLSTQFQLLVVLFGTNEVTFSSSDPGNIFTFNPTLSLTQ